MGQQEPTGNHFGLCFPSEQFSEYKPDPVDSPGRYMKGCMALQVLHLEGSLQDIL